MLISISIAGFSQKWKLTRYEFILGIGSANFFGDIGGSSTPNNWMGLKDISLLSTRPSAYLGARYKIRANQAIKLNLIGGWMYSNDKGSVNANRAYSFNSLLFEQSVQYEYSFITEDAKKFSFALFNRRGMINNYSKVNFYAFGGFGGVLYSPSYTGTATPVEYTKKGLSYTGVIPIGLGIKLIYNNRVAFGFEFGGRYSLSDYLDGFSTKYSSFNDVYYFGVFNLIYRLKTTREGYPIIFNRY
jgi:hypothetical protein